MRSRKTDLYKLLKLEAGSTTSQAPMNRERLFCKSQDSKTQHSKKKALRCMSEENITITIMNKDLNCNKIMKSIIKNAGGAEKRTF
jgi:hypothetical protein